MDGLLFEILLSLRGEELDADGILSRLEEMAPSAKPPAIASLYRSLKRGVERGFIHIVRPGQANGPGRPRQAYRLTPAGTSALTAEGRRLQRLSRLALSRGSESGS